MVKLHSFPSRMVDARKKSLKRIGMAAVRLVNDNVRARGGIIGIPIAPNAAATVSRKGSDNPLEQSGAMLASVNWKWMGAFSIEVAAWGNQYLASIHDSMVTKFVGHGNQVELPGRPFLGAALRSAVMREKSRKIGEDELRKLAKELES